MKTNKGTCIEIVTYEAAFQGAGGKMMQTYMVRMSDGGHGLTYAPVGEKPAFELGKEYSYVGYFTKNGKVKLQEASGEVDRDMVYAKVEALKLATMVLDKDPNVKRDTSGYLLDIKSYGVSHKMIAKSYLRFLLGEDDAPAKAAPATPTAMAVGADGGQAIKDPAPVANDLGAPRPHTPGIPPSMRPPVVPVTTPAVGDIKN